MELHTGVICVQVLYYRHMYLVSDMHGKCNCLSQFPLFGLTKFPFQYLVNKFPVVDFCSWNATLTYKYP